MLNWKHLIDDAQHAVTLDDAALDQFIQSQDGVYQDALRTILKRSALTTDFMQTSAPGCQEDSGSLAVGTMVGVWQIRALIGAGGMGEVYRVTRVDGHYEQSAALKLMRTGDAQRAAYFSGERQRLASLEHKGIARIIDGGSTADHCPYMVMEYVAGQTVMDYAKTHDLSQQARLRLFLQLCDAVSHAHGRLILHRDIKNQNVLVDDGGQVRLIDFGIASALDEPSAQGPLTLAVAPPEQLFGQTVTIGSDVFNLGVLLHQLLSGELPRREASGAMCSRGQLSGDLNAIINKTLALKSEDRYASVDALRDDVLAVLQRRPVAARNGGHWYRMRRFVARYPAAVSMAAAAVLALSFGLFIALYFASVAREEARQAELALAKSEFFGQRANMFYEASEAYADSLQHLFVAQAESSNTTQSELLLKRWQEALDSADEDPRTAAYLSYAIGRQFLFRNDYVNAKIILSAWLSKGYGEAMLRDSGEELLAIVYESLGQKPQALALMKKQILRYEHSYARDLPDHVALATRIAFLTEDAKDIRKADLLLAEAINNDTDKSPLIKMYYFNQLAKLRSLIGDEAAAHDAYLQLLAIIDEHPAMSITGVSTGRMNVADFEWNTGRASAKTLALVEKVLKQSEFAGQNRDTGRAFRYMAQYQSQQGNHQQAIEAALQARAMMQRFSPAPSLSWVQAELSYADVLAVAGRVDEARQVFTALKKKLATEDVLGDYQPLLALYDSLLNLATLRRSGNDVDVAGLPCPTVKTPLKDLQQRHLLKRLISAGVSDCRQVL